MGTTKSEQQLYSKKELLDIFVNHRVNSPFPGDWESIFRGSGYEFWSLRELEHGDSFRNIDWKATAKSGKYYVREYLAESYFTLMILYDISKSVSFGRKELLQANIAVSLAYSAIKGNNGCGLIMFADDLITYIPPRMGMPHFMDILNVISRAEPVNCPNTNIDHALTKLINEVPESLSFILSDFMYPVDCKYNFHRTTHGTSKHEVKAIQIVEDYETELPSDSCGIIAFKDYESGHTMLLDLNKWESFNEKMRRHIEETKNNLDTSGIDSIVIRPKDNFREIIDSFMRRAI